MGSAIPIEFSGHLSADLSPWVKNGIIFQNCLVDALSRSARTAELILDKGSKL